LIRALENRRRQATDPRSKSTVASKAETAVESAGEGIGGERKRVWAGNDGNIGGGDKALGNGGPAGAHGSDPAILIAFSTEGRAQRAKVI
jgi:hypothetical protein